jgi:hypothetical protein
LRPSLERIAEDRFEEPTSAFRDIEFRLKREFQRHFHRYSDTVIDMEDDLRWLGLMQHHGAPTRLLDWSYSFYVGVYFAAENAKPNSEGAVWAVNLDWCWKRAEVSIPSTIMSRLKVDDKDVEAHRELLACDRRIVLPLNPLQIDERLAMQQGLFLAPLDLTVNYMQNILGMGERDEIKQHLRKILILWDAKLLKEVLAELRQMNISRRTLFPDLDGLACDLRNLIPMLPFQPLHKDR